MSLDELDRRLAPQALALTQSDQTWRLTGLETTAADHGERVGRIDDGMRQIIALLNQLIEQGGPSDADVWAGPVTPDLTRITALAEGAD